MSYQINRHDVATWLVRNGFAEKSSARGSGHLFFEHASGVKVVIPGHGPTDLSKKVAGDVVRAIMRAGFDKKRIREELRLGSAA